MRHAVRATETDAFNQTKLHELPEAPENTRHDMANSKPRHPRLKKAWDTFILAGPAVSLLSGLLLLAATPVKRLNGTPIEWAARSLGRKAPESALIQRSASIGQRMMSSSYVLRSLNGIGAGLLSGQPSMIVGNLIQLVPSIKLAMSESPSVRALVTNIGIFLGGLFTVGFANELWNKNPNTPEDKIRRYDMQQLKDLFNASSDIKPLRRLTGLLSEMGKMTLFSVQDHFLMLGSMAKTAVRLIQGKPPEHGERMSFTEWLKTPTAGKSRLAVLFFYMGSIPIMLLERKNPAIIQKPLLMALKGIGAVITAMAPVAIALQRNDMQGRAPILAAPLTVLGSIFSNSGLSQFGEGFNDLMFSKAAVEGIDIGTAKPVAEHKTRELK